MDGNIVVRHPAFLVNHLVRWLATSESLVVSQQDTATDYPISENDLIDLQYSYGIFCKLETYASCTGTLRGSRGLGYGSVSSSLAEFTWHVCEKNHPKSKQTMSTPRRQTTLRSRVQTAATVGLAVYGAYKLGEWVVGAIRESKKGKDDEEETKRTIAAIGAASPTSPSPSPTPPPPCLDRETQRKLERHLKMTCARDSLALMQRMAPALHESIAERTSIAAERHELKRLRGDTTSTQRQQVLWRNIQTKTLVRFLLTMLAESLLFTVTWLHIHWVTASSSSVSMMTAPLLSPTQTSTLFRTLFNTILSFLDVVERQCQAAITQYTNDWDTHSDAALHMTYAKLKAGIDHCIADIISMNSSSDQNDNNKQDLWMQYVASLEQEFGESAATKDAAVAELLDLMESPLAKEVFPALFLALYVENAVRNLQQVFATKGELPLAQVIAKLSKQSFAQGEQLDRLVGLAEVQRISQIFFPED
jgi:hypothetical protein